MKRKIFKSLYLVKKIFPINLGNNLLLVGLFLILSDSIALSQVHICERVELNSTSKQNHFDYQDQINLAKKLLGRHTQQSLRKISDSVPFGVEGEGVFLSQAIFDKYQISGEIPPSGSVLGDLDYTMFVENDSVNREMQLNCNIVSPSIFWEARSAVECGFFYHSFETSNYQVEGWPQITVGDIDSSDQVSFELNNHLDEGIVYGWVPYTPENYEDFETPMELFGGVSPNTVGMIMGFSGFDTTSGEIITYPVCTYYEHYDDGDIAVDLLGFNIRFFYLIFEDNAPGGYLTLEPARESIFTGDSMHVKITALDTLGNEMSIPAGTEVKMFDSRDSLIADYQTAHTDSILFFAPDSLPTGVDSMDVWLHATLLDGSGIRGKTKIEVVRRPEFEIEIVLPEPAQIWPTLPGGNWSGINVNSNNIQDSVKVRLKKNDSPVPDKDVTITASFINDTGGHNHDEAHINAGLNLLGTFTTIPQNQNNNGTITGKTDANGEILLRYRAPAFSGKIILRAVFNNEEKDYDSSDTLIVRVPDLVELKVGEYFELIGAPDNYSGTNDPCRPKAPTSQHNSNHYGTNTLIAAIQNIAVNYNSLNSGVRLRINDMSLEWGGIFDIKNNFQSPHKEHRIGRQADIGDRGINQNGDCVDIKQIIMVRLMRNHTDTQHLYHGNHYHIRVSN